MSAVSPTSNAMGGTDRSRAVSEVATSSTGAKERKSLMELLTWNALASHPDYLEYRQKYLQWRTGSAEGARGEVSDIDPPQKQGDTPKLSTITTTTPPVPIVSRALSWPQFQMPERKLWMLRDELETDLMESHPLIFTWLQSQAGSLLQVSVLLLVVFTYAACPLTVSWATVVGYDNRGVPIKGRPFKESSVIIVSWCFSIITGLTISFLIGGFPAVKRCLDRRSIIRFSPAGVGWALADVCEVLAVARIDPAMYGVISQARLIASASALWCLRGVRQTWLQWGILFSLTVVCMAYCLAPDDPIPNQERLKFWRIHDLFSRDSEEEEAQELFQERMVGVSLALSKVALSVLSGVYGETVFKTSQDGERPELHVQMTQISFSSAFVACVGYTAICWMEEEDPRDFFAGSDGHWTKRTLAVSLVYCWREWICNFCVKIFDSLAKNICNAMALVITYFFTVVVTKERPFSALKVMLLLAVVGEVVNYVGTRWTAHGTGDAPEDPPESTGSVDFCVKEYQEAFVPPPGANLQKQISK
eukprot:CAMPEP_0170590910 /NCGR_PEP_ID=MMETSP0224-20130122/12121_1 /TAXON_ID=285029 /ORGANISM="Togula jolla, Strain CCCM 725" /LENGTH=532 /DNA_ID=CAMNT_0010914737 /DNA_START=1 /DNA_END=1599 /DNA_ORIENTATION=-